MKTEPVKKKKKENRTANPRKERKKKSKVVVDPLYVFNYNIAIEL